MDDRRARDAVELATLLPTGELPLWDEAARALHYPQPTFVVTMPPAKRSWFDRTFARDLLPLIVLGCCVLLITAVIAVTAW